MRLRGLGVTAAEYGLIATPPAPVVHAAPRTVGVSPGTFTIRTSRLGDVTDSPPTIAGLRLDILGVILATVVTTAFLIARSAK